ncbi:MAG: transketolase [bacterium]|jgi:transketolase
MQLTTEKLAMLEEMAKRVRRHIITMVAEAGSGHPGGALSIVEIVTALYFAVMRVDPRNPAWPERDRFILSKGHACPALYGVLAEKGYFPVAELKTLRKLGSRLQGHPDMNNTPGVEMSTGSLGQGLAVANGMALAGKLDQKDYRVYVVLGDGEVNEGSVWEAAMATAHYGLANVTAFLDFNGLQIDGQVRDVMNTEPLAEKWAAFGWHVVNINGHDFTEILTALDIAQGIKGRPTMIIANTVKGKGVSFMENVAAWHGKAPNKDQVRQALQELA